MWFDGGIQERCHFLFLGIVSLMLMKHFEKPPQVEGTEGVYEAQVGDESGEQLSTAELGFSMQERCHFRSFQISKVRTGPNRSERSERSERSFAVAQQGVLFGPRRLHGVLPQQGPL